MPTYLSRDEGIEKLGQLCTHMNQLVRDLENGALPHADAGKERLQRINESLRAVVKRLPIDGAERRFLSFGGYVLFRDPWENLSKDLNDTGRKLNSILHHLEDEDMWATYGIEAANGPVPATPRRPSRAAKQGPQTVVNVNQVVSLTLTIEQVLPALEHAVGELPAEKRREGKRILNWLGDNLGKATINIGTETLKAWLKSQGLT